MISTSQKYKQELIAGNRRYVVKVNMTLADSTPLVLTNQELWEQGVVISQAISSDDTFDIGSAIVGSLKLVIDNISGSYNTYDFLNATLTLYMGVENDTDLGGNQVYYRIGSYVVDDTSYNGSLINLDCLDNMTWFDVPFSNVNFPTSANTTAGQLVSAICSYVGVTLGTVSFPNYTTTIYAQSLLNLAENDYNCREILQFVAQKCCCYCKINTVGQLVLTWYDKTAITGLTGYDGGTYDTNTTPYSDGDAVDGMLFNPWNQGTEFNGGLFTDLQNSVWLSNNFDINVSTEEIVFTGCVIRSSLGEEDSHYDVIWVDSTCEQTHPRYALVIENNPLILKAEAGNIANTVGNTLAYLPARAFEARSLSDFSYETGDMATIVDFRGNVYHTWITRFTFTINNSESFGCGVQSVRKRNESRFSTSVQTLLNAEKVLSDYDKAVKAMNELAQEAIGYREYYYPNEATALDSRVTYRYNGTTIDTTNPAKPKFPNSTVVFKISGDGTFVSRSKDSQGYPVFTEGYDANSGTAILSLLYAVGLNAQWIKAGTIDTARLSVSGIVNGINNGTTTINGGQITTNTIDSGQLKANSVTAAKINAGAVGTNELAANAVTAAKMSVSTLDAISANMGTLTAGTIQGVSVSGCTITSESGGKNIKISGSDVELFGSSDAGYVRIYQGTKHGSFYDYEFGISSHYSHAAWNSGGTYLQTSSHNIIEAADSYSDERLKLDIEPINDEAIKSLVLNADIKQFKRTYEPDRLRFGVIAQDVRKQVDEVGLDKNHLKLTNEDEQGYYEIDYKEYIPMLMRLVQLQQAQIDELREEVNRLKGV